MKKKIDKYIQLLESILNNELKLVDFVETYKEELVKDRGWNSVYYKYLDNLTKEINKWDSITDYSDAELLKRIKSTLAIIQIPYKELEQQEYAEARRLELEEYHKELPLKLIELLAEGYEVGTEHRIRYSNKQKEIEVVFYKNCHNFDRDIPNATVRLKGEPHEYWEAQQVINIVRKEIEEEERKASLLKSAKTKLTEVLTPEELEILKQEGLK